MIKGFKDFLLRGNVIDLAVAVVIGSAFAALVLAGPATAAEGAGGGALGGLTASGPGTDPGEGAFLWLAVDGETARRIAGTQDARPLMIALRSAEEVTAPP